MTYAEHYAKGQEGVYDCLQRKSGPVDASLKISASAFF